MRTRGSFLSLFLFLANTTATLVAEAVAVQHYTRIQHVRNRTHAHKLKYTNIHMLSNAHYTQPPPPPPPP